MWGVKEKPFIKAASRSGPLPGFLFDNPVFAGFFAMIMCAVFGAVFAMFVGAIFGAEDALPLFEMARWGAIILVIFASFVFWGIAVSAFFEEEEKIFRLQFFFGGVLGGAFLVVLDRLAWESVTNWLTPMGRIV